ncbi:MAG: hypothetical protein IAF38_02125 [Bacteroidia bacterium]|nr:hypothetical protein [Bacteroidia bacterium]
MKKLLVLIFPLIVFISNSQNTATDGDWKQRYVKLKNTSEAELMIRHGDMDNLGFGWPHNFSPFSGKLTGPHHFPWQRDSLDAMGFDMIMVASSYNAATSNLHFNHDSYCKEKKNLLAKYGRCVFEIKMKQEPEPAMKMNKISLQLYVDDFQSTMTGAYFKVYINKKRAQFMEATINNLKQNGHTGRLITFNVPATFFDEFNKTELSLNIDDSTTASGDGFAIDFVKILFNPSSLPHGKAHLKLRDSHSHKPLHNAVVMVLGNGKSAVADVHGNVLLDSIPAGDAMLQISADGYPVANVALEIYQDHTRSEIILVSKTDPKKTHVQILMSHTGHAGHNNAAPINIPKHSGGKTPSANGNLNLLNIGGKK